MGDGRQRWLAGSAHRKFLRADPQLARTGRLTGALTFLWAASLARTGRLQSSIFESGKWKVRRRRYPQLRRQAGARRTSNASPWPPARVPSWSWGRVGQQANQLSLVQRCPVRRGGTPPDGVIICERGTDRSRPSDGGTPTVVARLVFQPRDSVADQRAAKKEQERDDHPVLGGSCLGTSAFIGRYG